MKQNLNSSVLSNHTEQLSTRGVSKILSDIRVLNTPRCQYFLFGLKMFHLWQESRLINSNTILLSLLTRQKLFSMVSKSDIIARGRWSTEST